MMMSSLLAGVTNWYTVNSGVAVLTRPKGEGRPHDFNDRTHGRGCKALCNTSLWILRTLTGL